jgi:hypothetical protein
MADMSFTVSNYAGTAAVPFVAPAILSADTIANGYCTVLDNVRYKTNLRKVSGGVVEARSCGFGTNGSLDISDVQLTLTELQVNEEICNHELARTWAAEQMRGNYAGVPGDYEQFLAQYLAQRVAEQIEGNIWQGNYDSDGTGTGTPSYTLFNGILDAYVDGAGTHETLVSGAFTNATIDDRLASLVADLPDALVGDPNTKIYMSRKSFQLYFQFLAAGDNNPVLATQMAKFYLGYEIITPAGFPNDTLLASRVDNMYFGTNVLTDHVEARFIDLRNTTGADLTRILMMFDGGTQIVDEASMACVRRSA